MTEDEMVGWHHRLDGHGFGWPLQQHSNRYHAGLYKREPFIFWSLMAGDKIRVREL